MQQCDTATTHTHTHTPFPVQRAFRTLTFVRIKFLAFKKAKYERNNIERYYPSVFFLISAGSRTTIYRNTQTVRYITISPVSSVYNVFHFTRDQGWKGVSYTLRSTCIARGFIKRSVKYSIYTRARYFVDHRPRVPRYTYTQSTYSFVCMVRERSR